jgi:hypothetical protein
MEACAELLLKPAAAAADESSMVTLKEKELELRQKEISLREIEIENQKVERENRKLELSYKLNGIKSSNSDQTSSNGNEITMRSGVKTRIHWPHALVNLRTQ